MPRSTEVPGPFPSPTVEVVRPAEWPISSSGPWLVYLAQDGLFAANPDGTGRTLLMDGSRLGPAYLYDIQSIASPSGARLAVYTFEDPERMLGPSLQMVSVPFGLVPWSTPLLSDSIEADLLDGSRSDASTAAEAVTLDGALAWAPDGRSLAFVAALDGPSSDLYIYDLAETQVRRVTSGPNQIASLSWSPDSQWIAHQAVEDFGTGAGWNMGAVWTVSPDGRRLQRLYTPGDGGEVFVGWSRGNSLISYSFSPDGFHDLRAAGAEGLVQNVLIPSSFSEAAYDPMSGTVAYAVPEDMALDGGEPGAFLWNPVESGSVRVDPGEWQAVQWSEAAGRFYFEGPSGVLGVTPGGEQVAVPVVDRVSVSPNGSYAALWGDGFSGRRPGIHIYASGLEFVGTLEESEVATVSWRPDSAGLMAMAEDGLRYYPLEGGSFLVDPSAIANAEGGLGWMMP